MIHDVKDDLILQDFSQELSMSSKYDSLDVTLAKQNLIMPVLHSFNILGLHGAFLRQHGTYLGQHGQDFHRLLRIFTILQDLQSFQDLHCLFRSCTVFSGFAPSFQDLHRLFSICIIFSAFSLYFQDFHHLFGIFTIFSGFSPLLQDFHHYFRIFTISSGFSLTFQDFPHLF